MLLLLVAVVLFHDSRKSLLQSNYIGGYSKIIIPAINLSGFLYFVCVSALWKNTRQRLEDIYNIAALILCRFFLSVLEIKRHLISYQINIFWY